MEEYRIFNGHITTGNYEHRDRYEDTTGGRSDDDFYSLLQKSLNNDVLKCIYLNADRRNIDSLLKFCNEFVISLPVHSCIYIFGNPLMKILYEQKPSAGELRIYMSYVNGHKKVITLDNVDYRRKDFI